MATTTALQSFLDLRSVDAARVLAARGLAGCRQLADALDDALRALAAPLPPGGALVAVGDYGRRELYRHSSIELLFLDIDATDTLPVLRPLWDEGLPVRHTTRHGSGFAGTGRFDLERLIECLDTHFVAGSEDTYRQFIETRQRLVRRHRGRIHATIDRRRRALIESEPWQLQEPDLVASRGGLWALSAVRWGMAAAGDAATALALQPEHDILARTRAALHALEDAPDDRWRPDAARAAGALLGLDPHAVNQQLLLAMRQVDAALSKTVDARQSQLGRWGRGWRASGGTRSTPDAAPTDLDRLIGALRAVTPETLEPLPPTEWLRRILPEWEALRGMPHPAPFHRHPVDVHAIRATVEARHAATEAADALDTSLIADELADEDELLLAALVHELGRAHPVEDRRAGAVLAERFASRVGFGAEAAQRLATATELHMLLPTVAARRDIGDATVVADVASAVGDPATLHLLYLLAVADARATGPEAWSARTAALMRTLYMRVVEHLRAEAPTVASAMELRHRAALEALDGRFPRTVVEAHLSTLPARYLLGIPPEAIGDHLALIAEADGGTAMRHDRAGDIERLTIVTRDRPGVLALVAGVLAVDDVNVLGGSVYARKDGVAIHVFDVADALGYGIDDARWPRIGEHLVSAFAGVFDLEQRLQGARQARRHAGHPTVAPIVHIDNSGPDGYSVIEVNAEDRVGLLHAIASALHEIGLDIHLAKVDTFGHEVADAFYVLRENGRRVEAPDEIERVRRRIVEAIGALDA